jgi:hypothetical protein
MQGGETATLGFSADLVSQVEIQTGGHKLDWPCRKQQEIQTAHHCHICRFQFMRKSYMAAKTGRTRCELGVPQLTGLLNSFLRATRLVQLKVNYVQT